MTILCVYDREPRFPQADQHPEAQRVRLGDLWVDFVGDVPTEDEAASILNPAPAPTDAERLVGRILADPDALALLKAELAKV